MKIAIQSCDPAAGAKGGYAKAGCAGGRTAGGDNGFGDGGEYGGGGEGGGTDGEADGGGGLGEGTSVCPRTRASVNTSSSTLEAPLRRTAVMLAAAENLEQPSRYLG